MSSVPTSEGLPIMKALIQSIQDNKQYLSDIDGLIGDGDHGINMNKGFTLCAEELGDHPVDLSAGLKSLFMILMTRIGGSMGPLYGMLFKAMSKGCKGKDEINAGVFGDMMALAKEKVVHISGAQLGDKTLLDCLIPAEEAYQSALEEDQSFEDCLNAMSAAAEAGRDNTKDLIAKVGRSSRLGERSKGVLDAGATSCCLILTTFAEALKEQMK